MDTLIIITLEDKEYKMLTDDQKEAILLSIEDARDKGINVKLETEGKH